MFSLFFSPHEQQRKKVLECLSRASFFQASLTLSSKDKSLPIHWGMLRCSLHTGSFVQQSVTEKKKLDTFNTLAQCHETFYGRNIRMFGIS
jgi:hypothetical protein